MADAQSDSTGAREVPARKLPVPDTVSPQMQKIIGQPLGELKLSDLSGKEFTIADLKDKVTVLHFWQYRDVPLEEPYGQVAYLDFILRRRAAKGVQVVGVHVDERLSEPDTQRASISSAKKFKAFFNLTYSVLLDDGQFLKRLGDPRTGGGKLPLFVVVGREGKVVEYHAGVYDVKPEQGLAELDAIIGKSLKTGE